MSAAEEFRHHNNPPPDLLVGDALREKLAEENQHLLHRRDELVAAAGRMPEITDEFTAGKVTDFIAQLGALDKAVEAKRTDAKAPYLEGGRNIDGFFKGISDPVITIKVDATKKLTLYERAKAERERLARLEEERKAREAAQKAAAEAAAKAAAAADEASLDAAIVAEKAADIAAADLAKAAQASDAKPAEMSRVRGEYGSSSSLRTSWEFDEIDRAQLDLEALRPYLPTDGLERAIRAFIKAGGKSLRGVRIFESTKAVVR